MDQLHMDVPGDAAKGIIPITAVLSFQTGRGLNTSLCISCGTLSLLTFLRTLAVFV